MDAVIGSDLFTLRETAMLSRVGEDHVRRELEHNVIEPAKVEMVGASRRLYFGEPGVLYFSMLRSVSGDVELAPGVRTRASRLLSHWPPRVLLEERMFELPGRTRTVPNDVDCWLLMHTDRNVRCAWVEHVSREWSERINRVVAVNWDALIDEVAPRIDLYRAGRARVRSDKAILGGESVFEGTRLAIRHIGAMRTKGEPLARILEDYPYLSPDDVEFAVLYTEAHPAVGRPKTAGAFAR